MLRLVTLVLMERGGSVACHGVSGWRLGRTTAGKSFYGVNLFRAFSLAEGGDDGDDFLPKGAPAAPQTLGRRMSAAATPKKGRFSGRGGRATRSTEKQEPMGS